jgi:hypothetical protein
VFDFLAKPQNIWGPIQLNIIPIVWSPPQLQKKTFKKSGVQTHILARCGTSSLLQTGGPRKNSNDSKDNLYPPSMTIQNSLPSRRVGLRAELPSSHFSIPDG